MTCRVFASVALLCLPGMLRGAEPTDPDALPPGAMLRLGSTRSYPAGNVSHLMFSADGKRLYSWDKGQYPLVTLTEWDVAAGRAAHRTELTGAELLHWQRLADGRGLAIVQTGKGPFAWAFTDPKAERPPIPPPEDGPRVIFATPNEPAKPARFLASPDGRAIYVGFMTYRAERAQPVARVNLTTQRHLPDLSAGALWATLPNNCIGLYATPSGRFIVTASAVKKGPDGTREALFEVRDAATGKERRHFTTPLPPGLGYLQAVAVSERLIAVGLPDEAGTVVVRELDGDGERRIATGHRHEIIFGVAAVVFNADGSRLVTGGRDGALKIWDVATGKELRAIANAFPRWIETLALSPDGSRVAVGGQAGVIRQWDLTTGAEVNAPPGFAGPLGGVALTPDGKTALTTSADGMLRAWDLTRGEVRRAWRFTERPVPFTGLSLAPDGRTALAGDGQSFSAWDVASGQRIEVPGLPADLKTHAVWFTPDGRGVLAFKTDGVTLLDWPTGKPRRTWTLTEPNLTRVYVNGGSLSPDGRWLALGYQGSWTREEGGRKESGGDSILDLFDATTGERVHRLVNGSGNMYSIHFTATGELLFAGGPTLHPLGAADVPIDIGRLHLVDTLTGRLRRTFETPRPVGPHWFPNRVQPAPDGRTVYAASDDGVIHVYEAATGKIRRSLPGHRAHVAGLAFSPDGRRLLSGSLDMTALVWEVSLAGAAPRKDEALTVADAAALWEQLRQPEAAAAFAAMARLAAQPAVALAVLRGELKPATVPAADDATLDRLVAGLDSDTFATREKARRDLDALGEAAVEGLRQRMLKVPSAEARRSMAAVVAKYDGPPTPERLREERALELLEQLNTTESRALLTQLAKGAPGARLTRSAADSLCRLDTRAK